MTTHEKRAAVWDFQMNAPPKPKRGKTDHEIAVAYGARGWVGPHGEKLESREQWLTAIQTH